MGEHVGAYHVLAGGGELLEERLGDAARYREICGDVGRCGEMWGDVG